jgi:hypothetical protein
MTEAVKRYNELLDLILKGGLTEEQDDKSREEMIWIIIVTLAVLWIYFIINRGRVETRNGRTEWINSWTKKRTPYNDYRR